jgi:hypothetical protein
MLFRHLSRNMVPGQGFLVYRFSSADCFPSAARYASPPCIILQICATRFNKKAGVQRAQVSQAFADEATLGEVGKQRLRSPGSLQMRLDKDAFHHYTHF